MYSTEIKIRVRYKETDQMGYVHHANYAQYYEIGRTEMFRDLGLCYRQMEADGYMLPVIELNSKFITPARYDDELTIKTILVKRPGVKLLFDYEIYNQDGTLLNTASSVLVMVNKETRKPVKPSDNFRKLFEDKFVD